MSQPPLGPDGAVGSYSITDEDMLLSQVGIEDDVLPDRQKDKTQPQINSNAVLIPEPSSAPRKMTSIFGGPIFGLSGKAPERSVTSQPVAEPEAMDVDDPTETGIMDSIETVDDDMMIIDVGQASSYAQKKWARKIMPPISVVVTDKAVRIKTEPGLSTTRVTLTPLEIQQAILKQMQAKTKSHPLPFIAKSRPPKETGQQNRSQPGSSSSRKEKETSRNVFHDHDDNFWTEQLDDGVGDENEKIKCLKILKTSLETRVGTGSLPIEDEVELLKIKQELATFERRRELSQRDAMFISSDEGGLSEGQGRHAEEDCKRKIYHYEEPTDEAEMVKDLPNQEPEASNSKRTRPKRKLAKTAREVAENRRAREKAQSEKKRRQKATSNSKVGKRKTDMNNKSKGRSRAKRSPEYVPKSRMEKTTGEELRAILEDLTYNNPIADRAAQGDYGEVPIINKQSNKATQLKLLLASVSTDLDTHQRNVDYKDLKKASVSFGFGKVKAEGGYWKLKGMKHSLYHHQLIGSHWMVGRELSLQGPKGGLLADAMGLGKTLEMIATMIGNPPSKADLAKKRRATLIVMPSGAIKQWKEELTLHTEKDVFRRVLHYKASMEIDQSVLEDCDIVLTSYAEVMNSFPWPSAENLKAVAQNGGMDAWYKRSAHLAGNLHKVHWYRVVLDEAHAIKNFTTRTSVACQLLTGQYRWAMTGTPIQNRLQELFPYFRFLRTDWTGNFDAFKNHFCDGDDDDDNLRMTVLLGIVMMRRTMKDRIFGRPIISLPLSHPETVYVHFTPEEKALYRILEDRFRENLNIHFSSGTAARNYNIFMVQLLRLRQCTAHPFLLEQTIKDVFTLEDVKKLNRDLKYLEKFKTPLYEQIGQWVQTTEAERQVARDRSEYAPDRGETIPFGKSDFGKYFRMEKHFASLSEKTLHEKLICRLCGDFPRESQITNCNHIFCKDCLENYFHEKARQEDLFDHIECPACMKMLAEVNSYKDLELRGDDDEENNGSGGPRGSRSQEGKTGHGKDILGIEPRTPPSTWLPISLNGKELPPPSAKTIWLKAQVIKWLQENRGDKILIFTQFRMMAKVIGLVVKSENIGFVYYTGDMNQTQRHEAVTTFHNNANCQIMIAGLKCGGQALNLTCANRVISIDVWFNHCVEQQAFGRVFRIGQRKETYFRRVVVLNSVDQRLLSMQAEKVNLIDHAMQDDGRVIQPMGLKDLASLFGHLSTDADGTFHVRADYDEEEGGGEAS